ncbi:MAG: LD-carboxypeptidase [Patescibacteria group bacterium]
MRETVKPKVLKPGDCIGLVAPSRFVNDFRGDLEKGIKVLENFGYKIAAGKHLYDRYYSSSAKAQDRADDINSFIKDPNIKAIYSVLGGDSCNQILDSIDYNALKENPKVLLGFSDITHLLISVNAKCNLVSLYAPGLKTLCHLTKESLASLNGILINGDIGYPKKFDVYKNGKAGGCLIGGNLFVINNLLATKYKPNLEGSLLFWEDVDDGLASVEFQLNQLKLSGALEGIGGMVIGEVVHEGEKTRDLKEIILELTGDYDFPIIKTNIFGHKTLDFYPIPIGVKAQIDTSGSESLKILESVFIRFGFYSASGIIVD